MDKKELKFYEAPACEVVEMKLQCGLLALSDQGQSSEEQSEEDNQDWN